MHENVFHWRLVDRGDVVPETQHDATRSLLPDDAGRPARPTTDWGTRGRRPVRLLAGVALIDAVDRGILPGVLTRVQDEFGFGDTAAGFLGTAFVVTGFLVTIPAGYLADRYRRTRIIATVLLSWGLISALNAAVRNYGQFLAVRAALGIGETVDNPASSSLIADYYRPEVRSRAYAFIRVAPLVGSAIGLGLGGLVGSLLGWRWAFLLVGVPGSVLAVAVWRLPEPRRGESDEQVVDEAAVAVPPTPAPPREGGARSALADIRVALAVPSVRALMVGSAIATGALTGLGFWAPAFYERHSDLSAEKAAGIAGALILLGAIAGTVVGGRVADRLRRTDPGAPMLVAGVSQSIGALLLMPTFLPVPLWFRMPVQVLAVAFILGGLPGLSTMISEVVPSWLRGITFSITGFLGALVGAGSPPLIGFLADQFAVPVDGQLRGHLANAFLCVTPFVLLGALVVLEGRRHVEADIAAARRAAPGLPSRGAPGSVLAGSSAGRTSTSLTLAPTRRTVETRPMTGTAEGLPALLAAIHDRTAQVVDALAVLDDDALMEPSCLPDWDRLTIACHLRYGAQALATMTAATLAGEASAYYPGGRRHQRPTTLQPAPGETAADVVDSLRGSSAALHELWGNLSDAAWTLELIEPEQNRDLGPMPLRRLPLLRLTEVEVHGSDLDLGLDDWSSVFVDVALAFRLEWLNTRRSNHKHFDPDVTGSWLLVATDGPCSLVTVQGLEVDARPATSDTASDAVIEASSRDLLALLLGRPVRSDPRYGGDRELARSFRRAFPGP